MGLLKSFSTPTGVPLEYHRITDIMIFTNEQNIINISSYVNQEQRIKEQEGLTIERAKNALMEEGIIPGDPSVVGPTILDLPNENVYVSPYTESMFFQTPYDQYMTIETAYEYLKTLPEFEGAIDC